MLSRKLGRYARSRFPLVFLSIGLVLGYWYYKVTSRDRVGIEEGHDSNIQRLAATRLVRVKIADLAL